MPRAHGGRGRGRGRGKGRGRGRAVTPVADGRAERRAALEARKAGLMEKALELAEVNDAAVAVVCSGIDGSVEGARAVEDLSHELPEGLRSTGGHASYVEGMRDGNAKRSKLAEAREGSIAAALDEMPEEALREPASIEVSREAARSRIQELQPQPDESVAENLVAGEEDACGEVQGTQKQPQGAAADDEDDDAWMEQVVDDLKMKPEPAPYRVAPHEYMDVGGGYMMERDAHDYIQYDLTMFTPYYGLPLRLWPWGDSSISRGAPLPPK